MTDIIEDLQIIKNDVQASLERFIEIEHFVETNDIGIKPVFVRQIVASLEDLDYQIENRIKKELQ